MFYLGEKDGKRDSLPWAPILIICAIRVKFGFYKLTWKLAFRIVFVVQSCATSFYGI